MKRATTVALLGLLATLAPGVLFAQFPDIAATWVGTTDFPGTPNEDPVTLVLKKAGNSYTGTITVATAKETPLENFKLDDEDTFTFEFVMPVGDQKMRVKARLDVIEDRVLGNKLMGAWTADSGEYGSLDLSRKK
jgi:hypothetical protein